jgi:hypothetical protein
MDKDGCLSEREFLIAQFLVFACKSGQLLPARLPQSLLDSLTDNSGQRAGGVNESRGRGGEGRLTPQNTPNSIFSNNNSNNNNNNNNKTKQKSFSTIVMDNFDKCVFVLW